MANPASIWFWKDWESDVALKMSSLAAQGLWMRMLCIAAQHDPIGYVSINRVGLDPEDIAKLAGIGVDDARSLIDELSRNGVFTRDRNGVIYNRRMVRDARKASVARKNGKLGGNPTLCNTRDISASDKGHDKGRDKPSDKLKPIPNPLDLKKNIKKEKNFKHELLDGWQPDESDIAYAKKLGLLNGHFSGQVEAMRLWAKANKILKVDWHATLKGFLRRHAEKMGVHGHTVQGGNGSAPRKVYVRLDTPQWDAWRKHAIDSTGKPPPTDRNGGWYFPAEWPPNQQELASKSRMDRVGKVD